MLIECPSCHARAQLPESKAGSKVRCGECGRVYLARPVGGARKSTRGPNVGLLIGVGVGVVALLAVLALTKGDGDEPETQAKEPAARAEEKPSAPAVDPLSWEGETVRFAVGLHEAAHAFNENRLRTLLHAPKVFARQEAAGAEEGARLQGEGGWLRLGSDEQKALLEAAVQDLTRGEAKDLVADWKPFDGETVELSDDEALVHLSVSPWDGGLEKRVVEWRLAKERGSWKAWSWALWISPEELAANERRPGTLGGTKKVELSDGSVVREREPEPLPHLEDTPAEIAARIDELYATLIDLEETRGAVRARDALIEIGRPAIPILLTGLYEIPLETEAQAIQCNLIVTTLRDITGQDFGYAPQVAIGSGVGTTEERRQSAIKQWFAWWYLNEKRFTEKKVEDGLEGLIELNAKEKRWLERHKD